MIKTNYTVTFKETSRRTLDSTTRVWRDVKVDETKKCEVTFKTIDTHRKVPPNVTVNIICQIRHFLSIYENFSGKKKEYFQFWSHTLGSLIPENITPMGYEFEEQYYVKKNEELLKPNQVIPYNKALFVLLGLNATEIDFSLRHMPPLCQHAPNDVGPIEMLLWESEQNQAIKNLQSIVMRPRTGSENVYDAFIDSNEVLRVAKTQHLYDAKKQQNNRMERESTTSKRVLIEKLYQEIVNEKPSLNKSGIASIISERLKKEHRINLSEATIRRDYL